MQSLVSSACSVDAKTSCSLCHFMIFLAFFSPPVSLPEASYPGLHRVTCGKVSDEFATLGDRNVDLDWCHRLNVLIGWPCSSRWNILLRMPDRTSRQPLRDSRSLRLKEPEWIMTHRRHLRTSPVRNTHFPGFWCRLVAYRIIGCELLSSD